MEFKLFKTAVQRQFNKMKEHNLFRVTLDKDILWDTYLNSFPEGTNQVYKERREYDCNSCKSFIRAAGNMVAIIDGKIESIWDVQVEGYYQVVADAMATLIKSCPIENHFLHTEKSVGVDKSYQLLEEGGSSLASVGISKTWEHFYAQLPKQYVVKGEDIGTTLSLSRATKDVMLRGLEEITFEAINTVLDLIAQNSLYRGEEHTFALNAFKKLKTSFHQAANTIGKDVFCWSQVKTVSIAVSKIRNTAIGTLLIDLSEGKDLEASVASFEAKVAPTNYKRPTALITKAMIAKAQKELDELGLTSALKRRFATLEDITINNIIFADREAKKIIDNVFDVLSSKTSDNVKNFDKVEEVTIEQFLTKIVPQADSIEVLFDNSHTNKLVSLIAPEDLTAKGLFKWDNNFSWSYTGDLTDSIKERVKQKGGQVEGDLRSSLSWFNYDDLDLHMKEPDGNEICYNNKGPSRSGGHLDIDMNAGSGSTRSAVENIIYLRRAQMKEGVYQLIVNNYAQRETIDVGFDTEVEFDGVVHSFHYPKTVKNKENVTVCEINFSKKEGFSIKPVIPSSQSTKQVWGLSTQSFHKVSVIMFSPNYWDEKVVGNKHYFFMLEGAVNDGQARGFYNEFLKPELDTHRKVLEMVGAHMKTEATENQLSGLGFSSTQKNTLVCRVKGSFTRTIKIIF